jgi:hypothetical protein
MHVALVLATVLQVASSRQTEVAACSFRKLAAERFPKDSQIVAVRDLDFFTLTETASCYPRRLMNVRQKEIR